MNESKRKDLENDQNKNSGGEGPVPPFSVENPCSFSEKCDIIIPAMCFPPLAQLDRVSDSDSEGHRFESCRAGHPDVTKGKLAKRPQDIVVFLLF